MHPWCRSTTVAVISEELLKDMTRRARDPVTGKVLTVPANMSYQEWYDKYVKGKPEAELAEKKIRNFYSDRKQWKKYRKILGENVPDSLDKFQNMKYNEVEKWEEIKEAYRDVNWQRESLKNHKNGEVHSVPSKSEPNSVFDKYENGRLIQRRYYGKTGKPRLDIDLTDHGNPKDHPIVPHRHGWKELDTGKIKRDEVHDVPLRLGDKVANIDIMKGGF